MFASHTHDEFDAGIQSWAMGIDPPYAPKLLNIRSVEIVGYDNPVLCVNIISHRLHACRDSFVTNVIVTASLDAR